MKKIYLPYHKPEQQRAEPCRLWEKTYAPTTWYMFPAGFKFSKDPFPGGELVEIKWTPVGLYDDKVAGITFEATSHRPEDGQIGYCNVASIPRLESEAKAREYLKLIWRVSEEFNPERDNFREAMGQVTVTVYFHNGQYASFDSSLGMLPEEELREIFKEVSSL